MFTNWRFFWIRNLVLVVVCEGWLSIILCNTGISNRKSFCAPLRIILDKFTIHNTNKFQLNNQTFNYLKWWNISRWKICSRGNGSHIRRRQFLLLHRFTVFSNIIKFALLLAILSVISTIFLDWACPRARPSSVCISAFHFFHDGAHSALVQHGQFFI